MIESINEAMVKVLSDIIRDNSQPLTPKPTGVEPRLVRLEGIRVVLFDVYGTLFVSGSGDVGTTDVNSRPKAFQEAFQAIGIPLTEPCHDGVFRLTDAIAAHHARGSQEGIEYPEVDIREVWHDVLSQLAAVGLIGEAREGLDETTQLALQYEVLTNPVWPMPGICETLDKLNQSILAMGIVSNAQVFTQLLFPSLLGQTLEGIGFDPELCAWSYQHRQAKPGTYLYEQVWRTLEKRGLAAREVLFIGNDTLKDVWPASRLGFQTALFAGDERSYRPRTEDVRVRGVIPDLVLTNLAQLPDCVLTR